MNLTVLVVLFRDLRYAAQPHIFPVLLATLRRSSCLYISLLIESDRSFNNRCMFINDLNKSGFKNVPCSVYVPKTFDIFPIYVFQILFIGIFIKLRKITTVYCLLINLLQFIFLTMPVVIMYIPFNKVVKI